MPVLLKFSHFLFLKSSTHYSIFSVDCLSCSNSLDEVVFRIGNVKTQKLFWPSLMLRSTLIRHLPPSLLFMYNMSKSLFGCNAPYLIIVFLNLLSKSFNSLSLHCSIPALYPLLFFLSFHSLWFYPIQLFITSLFGSFILSHPTAFPFLMVKTPHFSFQTPSQYQN